MLAVQSRNSSSNIGGAKTKTLDGVAAHCAKNVGLRHSLHGFRDDLAADPLIRWMTAWTITRAFSSVSMSAMRDWVELHPVERHGPQPRDVRIAGAEVVDGDAGAVVRKELISSSTAALTSMAALSVNSSSAIDSGTSASAKTCRSLAKKSARRPGAD